MGSGASRIISLDEFRKSRRGQAILLKRLIEQHLAEIGRKLEMTEKYSGTEDSPPRGESR